MFGISFGELILILLVMILVIKPSDLPQLLRSVIKAAFKIKELISEIWQEMGLEKIKKEIEQDLIREKNKLESEVKKTTAIIDIYGNEHQVSGISELRDDMKDEELQAEIAKYNDINSKNR